MVTCIVATHNRLDVLPNALASLRAQSYPNLEIIVVPDGCADGTLEYLQGLGDGWNLCRDFDRLASNEPTGPSAARNRGIQAAKGQYISFLDDDDTWVPEKIEHQLSLACQGFDFVTCTSAFYTIDTECDVYGIHTDKLTLRRMFRRNCVISVSPLLSTDLAKKYLFDEKLWVGEEWDLWIRLLRDGVKTANVSKPLIYYHRDRGESLGKLRIKRCKSRIKIYNKHKDIMKYSDKTFFCFITIFKFIVPDVRYVIRSCHYTIRNRYRKALA